MGYDRFDARFYDSWSARFIGVDPISDQFPQLSTYNYASNNPIVNIDLHGLQGVNVNFGCDGCPSIGDILNQITTSISDFFDNIGADDIVEEGNSVSTATSTALEIGDGLEKVVDGIGTVVPGVTTLRAAVVGGESTTDVALDLGGIFLPGLKFADEAKSAVKFSDEAVEFIQGAGEAATTISAKIPEGFRRVKGGGKSKIFTNGKIFISPDLDGHNGGVFKAAKTIKDLGRKNTRLGTFNSNLEKLAVKLRKL